MAFIGWSDGLSVGVKMFDDDHKKLIGYINKLHIGMIANDGISAMTGILDALADYTAEHFEREENLMIENSYPEYENQKKQHAAFVEKITDFQKQLNAGRNAFTIELMAFLRDWLINHIQGADMEYKDFFNGRGIK